MTNPYPEEALDPEWEDCGVMPANVAALAEQVVGHRIVSVETGQGPDRWYGTTGHATITLDSGKKVKLVDTDDCCAYTALNSFLLHADKIDHIITGVGTTDKYETWHIFADFGDVLELKVGWSCGNPFYYGYGFDIVVEDVEED